MKIIAVFLSFCILFLSSYAGIISPSRMVKEGSCCSQLQKDFNKSCEKNAHEDDCATGKCNPILSCSRFGFVNVQGIILPLVFPTLKEILKYQTTIGIPTNFSSSNWRPPK